MKILAAGTVFVAVVSFYLATAAPLAHHNDVFDFLRAAERWTSTGAYHPAHWPDYPGWVGALALLFKGRAALAGPPDPLALVWDAKALTIIFAGATASVLYLIALELFGSRAFAFAAAFVFAVNPTVWYWGQMPMSDVPALFGMLVAFLLFIRYFRSKRAWFLALSAFVLGLSAAFRLQALYMIVPFFAGILLTEKNAGTVLRLGTLSVFLSAFVPFLVYGPIWEIAGRGPGLLPGASDLIGTLKWYAARDIGWFWAPVSLVGFGLGLSDRKSRPKAVLLLAAIVAYVLHIADWYSYTGGDTDRYLLPTIPFTLLGLGFLWRREFLAALAAVYAVLVAIGLRQPDPGALPEGWSAEKFLLFPMRHASSQAGVYEAAIPDIIREDALARVLPERTILLHAPSEWSLPKFFADAYGKEGSAARAVSASDQGWYDEITFSGAELVVLHPSLAGTEARDLLEKRGFARAGELQGTILMKPPSP